MKTSDQARARSRSLLQVLTVVVLFAIALISLIATLRPRLFKFIYVIPNGDKVGHFLLMGGLAAVAVLAFSSSRVFDRRLGWWRCLLATLLVVGIEEVLQLANSTRRFDLQDLYSSFAGVILFGLIAAAIHHRWLRPIES